MKDEVTFVIKTFARPECLRTLVKSISKYYKDIPVIIVDDSKLENKEAYLSANKNIQYYKIEYDQGISFGRNFALNNVKTKYFLLLDDDTKFYKKTKLQLFFEIIKKYDLDIIGGAWKQNGITRHVESYLEFKNGNLFILNKPKLPIDKNLFKFDWILNFFLAKTESIKGLGGWDEKLKTNEHLEFFIHAKKNNLKVGYTPEVVIKHIPRGSKEYKKIRYVGYFPLVLQKYGIKKIVWPRNNILKKIFYLIVYIIDKFMEKIRLL